MTPTRVLVLDCWTRKSLSIVRSLGRRGVRVDAISHTRLSPAIYSRYSSNATILPKPSRDPVAYLLRLLQVIQDVRYDCVIPLEEETIALLLEHRTDIERYAVLPIAAAPQFEIADDKWATIELARELGIPVPRSARPQTLEQAKAALGSFDFPVIAKPMSSSGSRGIARLEKPQDLNRYYRQLAPTYGDPILQEAIPWQGQGLGVGCLVDRGKLRVAFSYKRLREFPVRGGPSTLRESTDDATIKEYARRLLERIGWHGVAMVEFKVDPRDGLPKLMEINPRFWGSVELANAAGVNFPFLLVEMARGRTVEQPVYCVGVRSRWLVPGDIAHFLSNPHRFAMQPPFFRFRDSNMSYDEFAGDDLSGSVATVWCTVLSLFDPATWRLGVFRR